MRSLHHLVVLFLLIVSLAGGSLVHGMESTGGLEVTAATEMFHSDHDHDQVPADADKNFPHHHNQCHGHDLAAGVRLCSAPTPDNSKIRLKPAAVPVLSVGHTGTPLRPPIA